MRSGPLALVAFGLAAFAILAPGARHVFAQEGEPPAPAVVPAPDGDGDRLREAEALKRVQMEEDRMAADVHYRKAIEFKRNAQYKLAQEQVERAIYLDPTHEEATRLLYDLQYIQGHRAGVRHVKDMKEQEILVKIEQVQAEVLNHRATGERLLRERRFDDALSELEDAERKLKAIPFDIELTRETLPQVQSLIRKAYDDKANYQAEVERQQIEAATKLTMLEEEDRQKEIRETIRKLFHDALLAFERKRFDKCISLCKDVLIIDPHYRAATELIEDSEKARHRHILGEALRLKVQRWKDLTNEDQESMIPYADTLSYPDPYQWAEISKRVGVLTNKDIESEEDPDILAIKGKLDTLKISLDFANANLNDIVDFIRDYANLNIEIDPAVRDEGIPETAISFKVKDLVLKSVLRLLLAQYQLDYTFQNKVLFVTKPENVGGNAILELHDVRDLLVKVVDFPGPTVELKPPNDAGGGVGGATFSLEEETEGTITEEQIEELIRENVAPGTWDTGNFSLVLTPNQQLLVSHTPEVQREVRQFLSKLRQYSGAMVSIEARFVAAHDNFLEDIGIDMRDLPEPGGFQGGGAPGSAPGAVEWDDNTGGAPQLPGFYTNEAARLESFDLRARLFHTFRRTAAAGGFADEYPLTVRNLNQGGLGVVYDFLGEQQVRLVGRALKKKELATLISAPRLTVFNTQRSNLTIVRQRAYVGDFEIAISQFAAFYDPVTMYIQDGVVLDVRPVISNDRKYVTVELRPSFAEFQLFRTFTAVQGGVATPPPVFQLPFLILQKGEMTVRIPDRGTVLVSGFKDILSRDLYSELPFFGKIPILNIFTSRKAKGVEKRRLLILVTPEIIDLGEQEEEIRDVETDRFPFRK